MSRDMILSRLDQLCRSVRIQTLAAMSHRALRPHEPVQLRLWDSMLFRMSGEVVKTCRFFPDGLSVEVTHMYVATGARNRGVARAVVWSMVAAMQEAGMRVEKIFCNKFLLWRCDDRAGLGIWLKIGEMCKGTMYTPWSYAEEMGVVAQPQQRRRPLTQNQV